MKIKNKNKLIIAFLISSFFYPNFSSLLAFNSVSAQLIPNDPEIFHQYYLEQIHALEAWDKVTEAQEVVVAVIDTGVDIYHPDLNENIWINHNEIKGDNIDNDNNGYIDDYQGWDFILDISNPRPKFGGETSTLGINHGTIVSGLIGALGNNNFGIAGVSWKIKIMPLRALNNQGSGDVPTVVEAVNYAVDNGADIINFSLVGNFIDNDLEEAIKRAYQSGLMIMAAAGNESTPYEVFDLTLSPKYPICYDGDNNYVFGVGSVGYDDVISTFSNYGSCIDIMAPGESFFSTNVYEPSFPDYQKLFGGYWSGTSVATPLVTATAALIKGIRPDLVNYEIYNLIKENADSIDFENPDFIGQMGAGRLNIDKVILALEDYIVSGEDLVIAPASGHSPKVQIISQTGVVRQEFLAYNENFTGGVNLTTADIDDDGINEIITAAGQGGGPHIRVFNRQGELLKQFFAYESSFTGGVNVVATDIDGDGAVEIMTAPQSGYQSLVKIFNLDGELKKSQTVFESNYSGGVNLAISDFNADGQLEIVVSQNSISSGVKIYSKDFDQLLSFEAYPENSVSGVKVKAFNLYGDNRSEFIVVPVKGYKPQLQVFSPAGNLENQWLTFTEDKTQGLNLTAGDINGDLEPEIVVSQASGGENLIKIFNYLGLLKSQFTVFESGFSGGINLAW